MEKHTKRTIKAISLLALLSLLTGTASGAAVYLLMNNNTMSADTGDVDYDVPDFDFDNPTEESGFSKVLNSLISSKEVKSNKIAVALTPVGDNSKDINLNLLNTDIDLSELNATVINIATNINVQYSGINQTLGLRIEDDEAAFVTFKDKGFTFNVPQNLSDVMDIIQAAGILVPNSASSTSELDLSSILSSVQEYANKITATESSTTDGFSYKVSVEDLVIKNTKVSGIDLIITSDKDYNIQSISTVTDAPIVVSTRADENSEFEEKLKIALNGDLSVYAVSSYTKASKKDYTDVTDANTSVLSTVAKIIDKKQANVGIAVSLDKVTTTEITDDEGNTTSTEEKEDWYDINGLAQIDCSNVESDFKKGTYAVSLSHVDPEDTDLNDISAYYGGETDSLYLNFNDLFKGKVSNATISDLFKYMSEGTGKDAIAVITNELDSAIGTLDMDKLMDGDLTQLNDDVINSSNTVFDYDSSTSSFILTVDGSVFGLGTTPIKLEVRCNNSAKEISFIKVSGLRISDVDVSVKLTVEDFTEITAPVDSEYSDYKGVAPVFESICDLVAKKQFTANYALSFNDRIHDGTTGHYNMITASGKIGADLTTLGEQKIKDGYSDGTYYLSMDAKAAESEYSHRLDMVYQNQNLYFGFDNISADNTNTVFKNYIEKAQLGDMMDLINSKTDSSTSSAFDSVSSILDTLSASEAFKNDIESIKKGSLKGLNSFISISAADEENDGKTENVIKVVLNVPYLFKDNSLLSNLIGSITLTVNTDYTDPDAPVFEDIRISTMIDSDQSFDFTLSFGEYESPRLTDEEISAYQKISDFNDIFRSFYNLPTEIKKYGIKVEATYQGESTTAEDGTVTPSNTKVSINGAASWDVTDEDKPVVGGSLTISHPYVSIESGLKVNNITANQKIEFAYQNEFNDDGTVKDGQFIAEYNDNMHILMHSSTVMDIVDQVSNLSETSLLNKLLTTSESVASSMPIKDVIAQKAPSLLLDYPYIHSVTFDDEANTISLTIDKKLFNIDDAGKLVTLTIGYTDGIYNDAGECTTEPTLDYVSADLGLENGAVCSAKISLVDYDEVAAPELMAYNDETSALFVNLDGFSKLTQMAIDTTEFNYFRTSGSLRLDLSLFTNNENQLPIDLDAYKFDLYVTAELYVADETTYAYVNVNLGNKDITETGFYDTEFFIQDNYIYINNTKNDGVNISATSYKVTTDEFKNNIPYYLLSVALDMDDRIAGKTVMANVYKALADKEESSEDDAEDDDADETVLDTSDEDGEADETEEATEETADAGETDEESSDTLSALTKDLTIDLSSDFSNLFSAGALYNEDKQKFSLNLDLNSLLSITYKDGDGNDVSLASFDDTTLAIYHQTNKTTGAIPFYGLGLHTGLSVLDGLARLDIDGKFITNANQGDLKYFADADDGSSTALDQAKEKMTRFFAFTEGFDAAMSDEYQITSFDILTKKFYDFTKFELIDFANDYNVVDNGNKLTYSVAVSEYTKGNNWYFFSAE